MANIVAQLAVKLGLETADFTQGLEAAKKGLGEISKKLDEASVIGTAAFAGMIYKSLEFSDKVADLADANEIAVEKVLALSEALNLAGGSGENAGKIFASFTTKIDAAAQGSKQAQDAFARIGVSLKDIGSMTNEQLFDKTINNLAKIPDVVQRNAIAFELLGKGIRGVSLKAIQEEMAKGTDSFREYADAVRLSADLHDRLEAKATKLLLIFTKELMPTVSAMFEQWGEKGGLAENVFGKLNAVLLGLWYTAGSVANGFATMGVYWDKFTGKIDSNKAQEELRKIYADQVMFRGKLLALDSPQAKAKVNGDEFAGRAVTAAKDAEADKQKQMLYTASLISVEYKRQVDFSLQQLKVRDAMVGMTNNERRIQEAVNQQLDSTSKKIDEINKLREAAVGRGGDAKVLAEYDKQIAKVKEIGEASAKAARQIEESSIAAQRTFSFGWNKAFSQYAEDAGNYAKNAEDVFTSITGNMTSAMDKFVDTGKLSFSSLAKSIIQDLIKIQLRMLMMRGISAMFGGIGGMFTAGQATFDSSGMVNSAADPSRWGTAATGGTIDGPTIVGENGPELFIPGRSGSVIPNNTMGDALSGGGGVTYNGPVIQNMQAIDTQSGIQFLAKNKMTIWSMNQSANRSIPTGR
jgi:lambda family phage tail tape measure protein